MPERVVVLTRAAEDNAPLARALGDAGARVIELPCTRVEHLADGSDLGFALEALGPEDRLVFTSRAGVDAARRVLPIAHLRGLVAAVGEVTRARCLEWGTDAWTPSEATGEALGREIPLGAGVVALVRAEHADPALPRELRARGANVHELVAYHVIAAADGDPSAAREALRNGAAAVVASPSAAGALADAVGPEAFRSARLLALGPTTARRISELGATAAIIDALTAHRVLAAVEVSDVAHR